MTGKSTTAPPPADDTDQLTTEARTEAAELKEDIQETRAEADQAAADGDTARAAKLEKRLDGLETDLKSVLSQIKTLAERPFHPAPEERTDTPSVPADDQGADKGTAETDTATDDTPPKPKGRRPSRRFFGSRAEYDD